MDLRFINFFFIRRILIWGEWLRVISNEARYWSFCFIEFRFSFDVITIFQNKNKFALESPMLEKTNQVRMVLKEYLAQSFCHSSFWFEKRAWYLNDISFTKKVVVGIFYFEILTVLQTKDFLLIFRGN